MVTEIEPSSHLRKIQHKHADKGPEAIFVSALYKKGLTKNRTRG